MLFNIKAVGTQVVVKAGNTIVVKVDARSETSAQKVARHFDHPAINIGRLTVGRIAKIVRRYQEEE